MRPKTGPRGGKRKSGACRLCDQAEHGVSLRTVVDVRKFAKAVADRSFGDCTYCGERGVELIPFGQGGRYHVRCFIRAYGFAVLLNVPDARKRARLCCIGKERMTKLLACTETVADFRKGKSK